MKTHYLYRTTNLDSGRIYIGVHSTNDFEFGSTNYKDKYIGSNADLKHDLKQLGRQRFLVEMLETFSSKREAYLAESKIVTPGFVEHTNTYNKHVGGNHPPEGSFRGRKHKTETRSAWSKMRKGRQSPNKGNVYSEEYKTRLSLAHLGQVPWNRGIPWSKKTKDRISAAHKQTGHQPRSQTGRTWITNGSETHLVLLVDGRLPEGFRRGRK